MKKALSLCLKYLSLFAVMGSIYYMIEIVWRGYSHISMFILAGVCGVWIDEQIDSALDTLREIVKTNATSTSKDGI